MLRPNIFQQTQNYLLQNTSSKLYTLKINMTTQAMTLAWDPKNNLFQNTKTKNTLKISMTTQTTTLACDPKNYLLQNTLTKRQKYFVSK